MATDVYEKLAQHLDNLPAGFPRTESGVEMRILRRLFTPEDAELALHLTLIPEEPRVIARRANISVEEAARRLEEMEQKRLILAFEREGEPPQYQAMQFFVGILEGQVNKLDQEFVQQYEEYMFTTFDADYWQKVPQLRTVPVGESISTQAEVMSYERAEELVRASDTFAVCNCICRQGMRIMGEGCDKPLETCLQFGIVAEHVVRTGSGRAISQDEALDILHQAEEVGLVLQPANTKDALVI